MQIVNKTTLDQNNVMRSLSKFLSDICFEGEFRRQPEYLTEIFEYILETKMGDNFDLRTKMMSCIKTSKMLVKALEPFSDGEIEKACAEIRG
ncbi:hypothetical protein [Flavobacterium sp. ABG]|uniref:hypothetical protein n=1 Tax=Flavobacterium sp. ABG TaxID=1423322 RepID=UPI000649FE15|nr:hypothetical protein [Flavobacterium sp. ABG]KLT70704.1 hypothetical protein AB674_06160 [Flavobacterium sp. ABG]